MSATVLLTLDLHDASSSQRKKFDEMMVQADWHNYFGVSTAYSKNFATIQYTNTQYEDAVVATQAEVLGFAEQAKIDSYKAVCLVSESAVSPFSSD